MPQRIQILIAEDDPLDAELLVRALRRAGFEFDWQHVDTEADYLDKLHKGLDLIFSDYKMPQFSGPRALELLKESGFDIPLIIMSGTIDANTAASVLKQGATDCLPKDQLTRLEETVRQALKQKQLRDEQK